MRTIATHALVTVVSATPVRAEDTGWRLGLGMGVGASVLDPDLDNYRWDVSPATVVDASASAIRGRWAAGLNARTTATVQATGIPGESAAPEVDLHMIEAHAAVRALAWYGIELWGNAHGGRMFLRYEPDSLFLASPTGGAPIRVRFAPIDEWTAGFGASLRREFSGRFAVAAQATNSFFALDTSHRRNGEIVEQRETFHNWSIGLSASWLLEL